MNITSNGMRRFLKDHRRAFRILVGAAAALVVLFCASWLFDFTRTNHRLGTTFSDIYARDELHLDPQETLRAILDDLRPQTLRLVAYWNELEPVRGTFDFSSLDWQMREAETHGVPVVLAVGYRTPRWPECHIPDWAGTLSQNDFRTELFAYFDAVVARYGPSKTVTMWQVENEPLLGVFGECPAPDREFLKQEIAHVKSLDPSRPVMTTASGELSLGIRTAGLTDVFGTTLYRYVWNRYIGNFTHVFPPAWYTFRAWFAHVFLGTKDVVIAELQAEPWGTNQRALPDVPFNEQTLVFGVPQLQNIVAFAKKTGIRDIYLWGPEWWYYRKLHGDPTFWNAGKKIFSR